MRKASWLIAGVLLGWLVAMTFPAVAHHQPEFRYLKQRVSQLESQLSDLQFDVSSLESRTSQLDSYGSYSGLIDADQVRVPILCSYGSQAIWGFSWEGLKC